MNEAETRAELIDPALKAAGWGEIDGSRVRREMIAPGRLQGAGRRSKEDIADYVLVYREQKLAVIEAKRRGLSDTEGLAQAKNYAHKLQTRFAFSTNGEGIYRVDMQTGVEGYVERYPSPDELWDALFAESTAKESFWRNRFSAVPFDDKGGQWTARYYQHNAINRVLENIAKGSDRILLTLATGTGKTAIAFQIAWKLFHSRWNLPDWRNDIQEDDEQSRRPRILFLADRNILADQAFNEFSAFADDAKVRIDPEIIRKKGKVPKNGSVFFTIFQTFMNGTDDDGNPKPSFGDYPPDFFDFIIIDECHRGGADDESSWRKIMEYFSPAVQLGLTATPKREHNADTYAYFGEPVYVYALKEGINDGYLTPFRVRQIQTTIDDYTYTPDDEVLEGEIEEGKLYRENDFNRVIEMEAREKRRVEIFMQNIDQKQKTLVFCANQPHALLVRNLINQQKQSNAPDYCVRVTAHDGKLGEQFLRTFQDNEKTIPAILTTSRKLSTGVDARNVRNIILLRPIKTMIEFKQIIGRGTRLFDGKDYFTIYDFVKAYEHFSDPEWDGDPVAPEPPVLVDGDGNGKSLPPGREDPGPYDGDTGGKETPPPRPKVKVKLADGKERSIQHMMMTSFWSADGQPISAAEFMEKLFGDLPDLFKDEEELRKIWSRPDTRKALIEGLEEKGYGREQLAELKSMINADQSDLYDVLAYIAFAQKPITREERVSCSKTSIFSSYNDKNQQDFLEFVLDHYIRQGVEELDQDKLPHLINLKYHAVSDAIAELGTIATIKKLFIGFQQYLYGRQTAA